MTKILLHLFLFLGVVFTTFTAFSAERVDSCEPPKDLIWAKASYAISGDTIIIQGQRARLIGLYAPQIERKHKFNTPGNPLAKESQTFLNKLLANHDLSVGIEYDTTQVDKSGRQLVHLFYKENDKILSVQQSILENGFAVNRTENDNLKHAKCYYQAEQKARQGQFQLWDLLAKNPELHFPLAKSSELTSLDDGFRIIQGKILKVLKSSTFYILNMDTTGLRIPKQHWDKFNYADLQALQGQTIEARGNAYLYKGVMFMKIDDPYSIDKLNPLNQPR